MNANEIKQGRRWLSRGMVAMALGLGMALTGCAGEGGSTLGENQSYTETVVTDSTPVDTTVEGRIAQLTSLIEFSPENPDLYYERSLLWYESGNSERAMNDIDYTIRLHNTDPDAYYLRGFYHYVSNEDSLALVDFKRAIDVGTQNSEVFFHIGQIHYFRNEYALAENAYREAIRLDTMNPGYYFAMGFLDETRGRTDAAIRQYELSLRRNPTFIKALSALHDIWLNEKSNQIAAISFNDRILAVDSTHPVGHFNRGNFYLNQANNLTSEKRLEDFQTILKLAITSYTKALRTDPNFARALYNRGYCFFLLEEYPKAFGDFSTVIQLDPYNAKAFYMMASIQEFLGDDTGALANYRQAQKIDPNFRDAAQAVKDLEIRMKTASAGAADPNGAEKSQKK